MRCAALPKEDKAKGLFSLASSPTVDHKGAVVSLWDMRMSGWRDAKPPAQKLTAEQGAKIIERSRRLTDSAEPGGQRPLDAHEDIE